MITGISDMEGNHASSAMVGALAARVKAVMREMGLTARVTVGPEEAPQGRMGEKASMRSTAVVPHGTVHARRAIKAPASASATPCDSDHPIPSSSNRRTSC